MRLNLRLLLALFMVFVLTILPLPHGMLAFRPPFILLFVLYIEFFLPSYFNITGLILIALCMDVLLSTVIGEHAFALLLTTWCATGQARRFRFFSMVQQMILVTIFYLIYQLTIFFIEAFLGYQNSMWSVMSLAFLSMMIWPWVRMLADGALLVRRA